MRTAVLVVRAVVDDDLRAAFEAWYRDSHVPLAESVYRPLSIARYWSSTDLSVHYALYEFPSLTAAHARMTPEVIRFMAEDFEAAWPRGVVRTRELLERAED